jgi:membrane protease YdiL (CAAX protease family)
VVREFLTVRWRHDKPATIGGEHVREVAATVRGVIRVFVGVVIGWLVFDRLAAATGSVRGEHGVLVGAVVVATVLVLDRLLFGRTLRASTVALGLGRPSSRGLIAAAAIGALLLLFFPLYGAATGATLGVRGDALLLIPGLLAQAGVAEELLFRGFLFGELRRSRTFWRAALLALPPFFAVHLLLFLTMPPAIAAAATLLSAALSFPLARLYELGGRTIWAPALLHAVIQGAIKLVVVEDERAATLGLGWMAVCLVVPWLAFTAARFAPSR